MKKRLLALLLCLSMLLSFTVSTYAEGNGDLSSHGYYDDFEDVAGSDGNTNTDGDTSTGGDTTEIPVVPAPVVPAPGAPTQPGFEEGNLPGVTVCEECGAANGHAETCSQYVAPKDEADAKNEYYKLDQVAGACKECGGVDGHLEGCSQYEGEFSVEAFYAQVMSAESVDEIDDLFAALTDEELALVESTLTEEQIAALSAYVEELEALEAANAFVRPVDVTNAAPFLPPVVGEEELVMDVPMVYNMRTLMASASANSYAVMPLADEDSSSSTTTRVDNAGVVTTKTATMNADGTKATIRLETYVTGSKVTTTVKEEVPTDIVLVLDQSGSMAFCIQCGEDEDSCTCGTYTEATFDSKPTTGTYYYKDDDGDYQRVYYCSWCEDWYTGDNHNRHWYVNKRTPKLTDGSGSYQFYTKEVGFESRLDSLKDAVDGFLDDVVAKAAGPDGDIATTADNVDHRVAIVGFASGIYQAESWEQSNTYGENTELLSIRETGSTSVGKDYYVKSGNSYIGNLGTEDYKKVLQEVTDATGRDILYGAKDALDASGATRADLGLEMAMKVFENNPLTGTEKRNRVVIFFTDGQPTGYNGFSTTVANNAIGYAKTLKAEAKDTDQDGNVDGYGATVYSVGIFSGANGTPPAPSYSSSNNNDNEANCNRFMHYVSSNYPEATVMNNNNANATMAELDTDESYYLSASDRSKLNSIFEEIGEKIESSGGASTTLGTETVVQDVMSQYFTLPAGTKAEDIEVYTADYKGTESGVMNWDTDTEYKANVTVTPETATEAAKVSVTNFDFSANYVGYDSTDGEKTARGKKLIIVFEAEPKDGFWGGNGVPTNDLSSSGVYNSKGTLVENFEEPKVDVPIKTPSIKPNDQTIYYGNAASDADDLFTTTQVPSADNELWKIAYVNVTLPSAGTVSSTECGAYTGTITVTPKTAGKYSATSASATANVHVLVPTAEWPDITIYQGNQPVFTDPTTIQWVDPNAGHSAGTATGNAPKVTFQYNPTADAANTYTTCTDVTPMLYIGEKAFAAKGNFKVHVLIPEVTVNLTDDSHYYGDTYKNADAVSNGFSTTLNWTKEIQGHTGFPTAQGTAPAYDVTLKYFKDSSDTAEFTSFVMPDADETIYVKAYHGGELISDAKYKTTCDVLGNCTKGNEAGYFTVHPDFCELTINKTVETAYDANDTFLFNVVGDNPAYRVDMDVVIQGSGSVTIGHLPVGQYTVTEDATWSWRYDITGDQAANKSLNSGSASQTWNITNDLGSVNKDKWLTFSGVAENTWSNGINQKFVKKDTVTEKKNQARRKASK